MSRKTITTVVILAFAAVIAGMLWFFASLSQSTTPIGSEGTGGFLSRLFPGGQGGSGEETPRGGGEGEETPQPAPRLRLVSTEPVAGGIVFLRDEEPVIRFMERATSHIYETSGRLIGNTRITNTTLPAIQHASFSHDGSSVVFQYLEEPLTVKTFAGSIIETEVEEGEETEFASLEGAFLPNNVASLTRRVDGPEMAYLVERRNGGSDLFLADAEGREAEVVFSSPVTEWLLEWNEPSSILFVAKPTAVGSGYAYRFNTDTGTFERLLGKKRGLTASLSPDGERLLYSQTTDGSFSLFVLEIETGESVEMPVSTLPEKCAWSRLDAGVLYCGVPDSIGQGDYPDVWHQGRVSFSDSVWEIDTASQSARLVMPLREEAGQEIDIVDVSISPDEAYLLFTNKTDLRLWSLRIAE